MSTATKARPPSPLAFILAFAAIYILWGST